MAFVGAHSDRGRVKSVDQDACCYLEAQSKAGRIIMAVVCDGVGGLSKGELASTTVIQRFADWFTRQLPRFIEFNANDDSLMGSLRNVWDTLLQMASEDIFTYGERNRVTLGTTFTGMIVVGGRYLIAHVGDCRAYEVRGDGGVVQLTHDQTLVAQQVAAGVVTPEEAAHHPKRNVILQSVGTSASVTPEFVMGAYDPRSMYVFCCDGFYNKLQSGELATSFLPGSIESEAVLQDVCVKLVEGVMARGEKDNITVLGFTEAGPGGAAKASWKKAKAAGSGAPSADAARPDGEESPTVVVGEDESPTMVVQGGGD